MFFLLRELKIKQKIIEKREQSRPSKVEVVKYKTKADAKSKMDYVKLNDIDQELIDELKNYR